MTHLHLHLVPLLILTTLALHSQHFQSTPTYNNTAYLSDLQARQQQFLTDVATIRQQIDAINSTINSSTLSPGQMLGALSEGMADQRDTLYNIEKVLFMPFEIEPCKQVNLSTEQRNQLQQQINTVNTSLNALQAQANFCPECPQIAQIQLQIQKQYNYLRVIEETVHSDCLTRPYQFVNESTTGLVNLANSLYKDNLKATGWVYGNMTEEQYRMYLFTLGTQYNLTSCPINRPFVDVTQKSCIACYGTYNVGQRKCYPCPTGQHYNHTTLQCQPNPKQCPSGTQLNTTTDQCVPIVCGQGLRLDANTSKCVSICTAGQYYNTTTKACQAPPVVCESGYYYNSTTKKCQIIVCPQGQIYDTGSKQCIDRDQNTISLCPPERPYWNSTGMRCQLCPSQYPIYNAQYNRCQSCPAGYTWNTTKNVCEIHCPPNQMYNLTTKTCEYQCPTGQFYNLGTKQCQINCPSGQVYNSSSKMCEIVCASGQVYNPTSKKCQTACPSGQIFNQSTNACQSACRGNSTWDPTYNKCVCPHGYIFNNDLDCVPSQIVCQDPTPLWNSTSNKCEACPLSSPIWSNNQCTKCPADRPNYSPRLRQCLQPCPSGYFWNTTAYRCDMIVCSGNKPILNFKTGLCQACPQGFIWVEAQKTCKSNFTGQCPPQKPFYNSVSMACEGCPTGTRFNKASNLCQYCPVGTHLDPSTNTCIPDETCATNPNLCPQCPPGYIFDKNTKQCQIVSCPTGYVLNQATGLCQKCATGYFYNTTTGKCQTVACVGGFWNEKTQKCQNCLAGSYPDSTGKSCFTCEAGTFYSPTQKGCVRCPDGTYFDQATFTCHQCPQGTTYNPTTKVCIATICLADEYYSLAQKKCKKTPTCPPSQFFDLTTEACKPYPTCQPNQIFNQATKQCQPVPSCPDGFFYNPSTTKCQPSTYLTSKTTKNLIYAYNFTQYQRQYDARKLTDPNAKDCPSSTPFLDRNAKICVSCPGDRPYFNLHSSLCQNCGNAEYDAVKRQCKSVTVSVDPTLERLIMNIL